MKVSKDSRAKLIAIGAGLALVAMAGSSFLREVGFLLLKLSGQM